MRGWGALARRRSNNSNFGTRFPEKFSRVRSVPAIPSALAPHSATPPTPPAQNERSFTKMAKASRKSG